MDEPSTSPEPSSEEHPTDSETTGQHSQHSGDNIPPTNTDEIGKSSFIPIFPATASRLLEVALTWILWIIGSDLQGAGHKLSGYILNCLAVVAFLLLATDILFGVWPRRKQLVLIFSILCIVPLMIYTRLYFESVKPPRPEIELSKQVRFSGELDDPIRRVFLIFRLAEINRFESLRPIRGSVEVDRMVGGHAAGFNLAFKDLDSKLYLVGREKVAAYQMLLSVGDQNVRTQDLVLRRANVTTVGIPVPLWSAGSEIPFKTLRDFQNSLLVVGLSSNLTNKLKSIEFVVNGWAIFHREAKGMAWRGGEYICTLISRKETMEHRAATGFDLKFDGEIPFYSELSSAIELGDTADVQIVK